MLRSFVPAGIDVAAGDDTARLLADLGVTETDLPDVVVTLPGLVLRNPTDADLDDLLSEPRDDRRRYAIDVGGRRHCQMRFSSRRWRHRHGRSL